MFHSITVNAITLLLPKVRTCLNSDKFVSPQEIIMVSYDCSRFRDSFNYTGHDIPS